MTPLSPSALSLLHFATKSLYTLVCSTVCFNIQIQLHMHIAGTNQFPTVNTFAHDMVPLSLMNLCNFRYYVRSFSYALHLHPPPSTLPNLSTPLSIYMQDLLVTLKGSPSKLISSSPRNFPSSRSSLYLLQGPREGSLVISEG